MGCLSAPDAMSTRNPLIASNQMISRTHTINILPMSIILFNAINIINRINCKLPVFDWKCFSGLSPLGWLPTHRVGVDESAGFAVCLHTKEILHFQQHERRMSEAIKTKGEQGIYRIDWMSIRPKWGEAELLCRRRTLRFLGLFFYLVEK